VWIDVIGRRGELQIQTREPIKSILIVLLYLTAFKRAHQKQTKQQISIIQNI